MSKRADIKLADQLDGRQKWKDPLVDAVVATFCVRTRSSPISRSILDRTEWLVTKRVKGAEKGQFQAHHGGFLKVTDSDIWTGACREVVEETGYQVSPANLIYLTSVGPAIFRSELTCKNSELILNISSVEAEPTVGFACPLFLTDVSSLLPEQETDGEVEVHSWMTAREIIEAYGSKGDRQYSLFNYFQMFIPALLLMAKSWIPGQRAITQPGRYTVIL